MRSFFKELKRRHVIKVAIAYAVVAWILIEVSSVVFPILQLPEWTVTFVTALLILGFPVALVLAWAFDLTPDGIKVTPSLETSDQASEPIDSKPGADGDLEPPVLPPRPETALAAAAVLPFEILTPSSPQSFIADAISVELQNALASVPQLRVASRQSSMAQSVRDKDIRKIARDLDVQYVISGSVAHVGDNVRVVAEMADAVEDTQLWSKTYNVQADDVLTVLEQINHSVVSNFGGVRLRTEVDRAHRTPAANLNAWELVQKAGSYLLDYNAETVAQAVPLLEQAIDLDSDYAVAHATLGIVTAEKTLNAISVDADADRKAALAAVHSAELLAPRDPFVLRAAGCVQAYCGDYRKSIGLLRRAVDLAPYDLGTWGYFGWPLVARGEEQSLHELHAILDRLLDTAPKHPGRGYWLFHRSVAFCCEDHSAKAVEPVELALEEQPRFALAWMHLASVLGRLGRVDEARDAIQRCAAINDRLTIDYYIQLMKVLSDRDDVVASRCDGLHELREVAV